MKKFTTVFAMLATILVACNKEDNTVPAGTVKVSIEASDAASKVEFGEPAAGKRPVIWSAEGEDISLWEFADGAYTQAPSSDSFVRNESDKSHATFSATLEEGPASSYDYVAVYPSSVSRNGNRTSAPAASCISYALSVTATDMQKPSANGPDKNWMVLTAVKTGLAEQPVSMALAFEHQTAYGKMTFKNFPLADGETLQSINITGPNGKYFTGRRWYDYKTGDVTAYSDTAQKNTFTIDASEITANKTSFDIWFSVLPVDLAAGEKLTITAKTSANTRVAEITLPRALNFTKGEIADFTVNWSNYISTDKTLVFDFTGAALDGWPTSQGNDGLNRNMNCIYPLGGVNYTFNIFDAPGAKDGKIFWNETNGYFSFAAQYRYMSLPIISDYTLKSVACIVGNQIATSSVYITDEIGGIIAADHPNVVCAAQSWNVAKGTVRTYDVNSSNASKQYYLYCKNKGAAMSKMTLTYSPVE